MHVHHRLRVLSVNAFAIATAPGLVAHELGHYAMCRLLGVPVERVVLFDWPDRPTREVTSGGRLAVDLPDAPWKVFLVDAAPLLSNTAGAFVAFFAGKALLLPPNPLYTSKVGVLLYQYEGYFWRASALQQSLAIVLLWVGVTLAYYGFPSRDDLRTVGDHLADSTVPGSGTAAAVASLFAAVRLQLAVLYATGVTLVGLLGVGMTLQFLPRLDFLLVWVVLYVAYEALRDRTSLLPASESEKLRIATDRRERAAAGESLGADEVEPLIDQLADRNVAVRDRTARALAVVARRQPAAVAGYQPTIFRRLAVDGVVSVRACLLRVLASVGDTVADRGSLATLGCEALSSGHESVRTAGAAVTVVVASLEPALLRDDVDLLVRRLDGASADGRADLALAVAEIADEYPGAVEPHADVLREYRDDESEAVRERIGEAVDAVETAA